MQFVNKAHKQGQQQQSNKLPFAGVVLAGGKSSRMGQDKAQLILADGNTGEQTLLTRSQQLLSAIGASQVFTSRNDNQSGSIADIFPGLGPLAGIYSALQITHLPLLVTAVDMPLLSEKILLTLAKQGLQRNTMLSYVKHPLPLFIPNNDIVKSYLFNTLSKRGDRSIMAMLKTMSGQQIKVAEELSLTNVNTPEQWQQAQALRAMLLP